MPNDPRSEEFAARHKQLCDSTNFPALNLRKAPAINSYGWLVDEYLRSGIKGLDKLTQDKRRQLLEATKAELVTPNSIVTFASFPLSRLETKHLRVLRDRKEHVPSARVNRVKAIKAMFKWALAEEKVVVNPARDLTVAPAPAGGHHSWTVEEVRQFEERHPIGTKARLALALLLWTGVRRSDLVKLGKQHVRDGKLRFTQQKNRKVNPVQTVIPVLPELQQVLDASPTGNLTFLVTASGAPYTVWGFGNWFRDRCVEAGVPGRAHGLRKAAAAIAAENGATTMQLMAWFDWLTIEQAEVYVRAAQREKMALAAMGTLVRR
jgi:integrase